ncbi:MAG: hypothetical protein HY928_15830 [Elusimicrobia bacterium]|nr:hypothetical protein [Elusimicrobiota bacterium]
MIFALLAALALPSFAAEPKVGVLVMAHGGDPAWNAVVEQALEPLKAVRPTALAYGMADAATLQKAVAELEGKGVRRTAVVRLFLSGDSFLVRTEKILGLASGAGERPRDWDSPADHSHHHEAHAAMAHMDPDKMPLWKVVTVSTFALSREGLLEAGLGPPIMAKRALALSKEPAKESVLLVAHGVGDDKDDARWREAMAPAVAAVRKAAGFRRVQGVTLRDDWPEAHARSVAEIKAFVADAGRDGGRALVVPYRLFGFGPQAGALAGLDIVSDDKGLLPDPLVGEWLKAGAERVVKSAGW